MKNTYAVLKKLLSKGEQSPRNYAGVVAVWDRDRPCWAWTDGYSVIGQGDYVLGKPGYVINSKHVKVSEIKGYAPLTLHEDVRAPNVSYPNLTREILHVVPSTTLTVNAEIILRAIESLKKLSDSRTGAIQLEISEDRIRLKAGEAWAIVCTMREDT